MRLSGLPVLAVSILSCTPKGDAVSGHPGTPLSGLSAADSARFYAGMTLFNKVFTPDEGLGPAFNENQCSACHTVPAIGGTTGFERIVKATHYSGPGACDLLSEHGGENVRTSVTPASWTTLRAAISVIFSSSRSSQRTRLMSRAMKWHGV